MAISNYVPSSRVSQAGVCTSTTRPASPYEGQMIYETDTNRVLVYDNTAWVMIADTDTPPGLELIKTQTVGSAVSSVTVSDVFSSTYDNYYITCTGGTLSTLDLIYIYMGSSSGSGYYGARTATNTSGAAALAGDNNTSGWLYAGVGGTTFAFIAFELYTPYLSQRTGIYSRYIEGTGALGTYAGYLNNTTSYTGFTLDPAASTMTGGTIRVYGYRNS